MPDDDTFTPEEEADFGSLSSEELAKLERFIKWRGQKASPGKPVPSGSPPSSPKSPADQLTAELPSLSVKQLAALTRDPDTSSILRSFLKAADELASREEADKAGKKPAKSPTNPSNPVAKLFRAI